MKTQDSDVCSLQHFITEKKSKTVHFFQLALLIKSGIGIVVTALLYCVRDLVSKILRLGIEKY